MGFLSGLLNNASETSKEQVFEEVRDFLIPNESVEAGFKLIRDLLVFTDKRLIVVDKQGVTGKKIEYQSIPYKNISRFSVETMGALDIDAELKIWISGSENPALSRKFSKDKGVRDVHRLLSVATLS
ncbi:PH domain-containing protein [Bacillus paralicheniformis]|uniref:PH domain-containing protein n=1 Tax=Bacillus TaxID=1386 RepID=UPI0013EE938E|nr:MULTISPECIES: PH domain-containing protein [Bacillus]QII26918.1 PH domain-containing protein [Bacillus altitudinis]QII51483.1 PH domain-containing protein [Bacillus paralicheniformis]